MGGAEETEDELARLKDISEISYMITEKSVTAIGRDPGKA